MSSRSTQIPRTSLVDDRYSESETILHQRVALLATVLFPMFGLVYANATPDDWDPAGPRIAITVSFALVYVASRISRVARRWVSFLLFLADQPLIHWINILAVVNGMSAPWVIGIIINHFAAAYVFTSLRYNLATHASVLLGAFVAVVWTDGEGEVAGVLLLATVITLACFNLVAVHQRRTTLAALASRERELEQAHELLEERVQQRTTELRREVVERAAAERRAHEANLAKSQFLATMSHELRTPLNAIIGYGEIVEESLADQEPVEPDDVDRILVSARHLLTMINEILDLARIESGTWVISVSDVELGVVIERAVNAVRPVASQRGNTIEISVPANLPTLKTDEVRLLQIMVNLLSNAAKFTEAGTIGISCRADTRSSVIVEVRDTGIGIPDGQQEQIFERFVQVDGSFTRRHGGTGLGLAIGRELARALGGDLTVASNVGAGSIFTLTLPVTAKAERANGSPVLA